jgi:hypothetical protein
MAKKQAEWRSRIVGHGRKRADQFTHNPRNPKFHPVEQRNTLRGVIGEVGQVAPVIENVRTGYLVDGHERVWLALETNAEVDFIQIDVDESEEAYILSTLDPVGWMATHDKEQLDALLRDVATSDEAVMQMLAELAADNGIITLPDVSPQLEPQLKSEVLIEIRCSEKDLQEFESILDEWSKHSGVTVNIS